MTEAEGEASAQLSAEKSKNFAFQSFGAQFCEVKVDEPLAQVRVTRWVGAFDPGVNKNTVVRLALQAGADPAAAARAEALPATDPGDGGGTGRSRLVPS
ncbi:MAG TPA: hypothetical protein VEL76_11160 [Gemmataceae bacterium]|nr:hypothetical protein [Gemmataceae bacterium]